MRRLLQTLTGGGLFLTVTGMAASTWCYDTGSSTPTYCLTESIGNADWVNVGLHEYFTSPATCSVGLDYFGQPKELAATVVAPTSAPRDYAYVYAWDALQTLQGSTSAPFGAIYGSEIQAYPSLIYPMGQAGAAYVMEDEIDTYVPLTPTYGSGTAIGTAFVRYDLTSRAKIVAPSAVDVNEPFEVAVVVNPAAFPNATYRWTSYGGGTVSPTPTLLQRSYSTPGNRTFTVVVRSPLRSDSAILTKSVSVTDPSSPPPCGNGSPC